MDLSPILLAFEIQSDRFIMMVIGIGSPSAAFVPRAMKRYSIRVVYGVLSATYTD